MSGSLEGKVAIVTGSSSGIGEAIARLFAEEGCSIVVNSSSSVEAGQEVASSLPDAIYSQANIADEEQAKSLVEAAIDKWGRLDVLINNAGATRVIPHDDLDAVTAEDWDRILKVNIVGTWFVTRAAAPALKVRAPVETGQ